LGLLGKRLAIAIPDTVLEENDSLREKTVKLGAIARACAIYGVDIVEVFRDERGRGEAKLIKKVLEYLETPQYLRRKLYPLDETLRYAGLLPPLRIPSHKPKVALDRVTIGEIREGVTNGDGGVDVGLERPLRLTEKVNANKRVTVKLTSKNPLTAELAKKEEIHEYWGYTVELKTIQEVTADGRFGLKIATSRFGNSLQSQIFVLRESLLKSGSVVLLFGAPSRGLFDIVGQDLTKMVNFVVNLYADQHVEHVRTEEAIFAGLNLMNTLAA
jgi:predicted SPOUT superfamily RNA methylase MTH1